LIRTPPVEWARKTPTGRKGAPAEDERSSADVSGAVADRKRLIRITAGNLRNNHIYITGHYDFFPKGCGTGTRNERGGYGWEVRLSLGER
jgi:hypothetical protein